MHVIKRQPEEDWFTVKILNMGLLFGCVHVMIIKKSKNKQKNVFKGDGK